MASVTIRNLGVLAYGNGFTLWHYRCPHVSDTSAVGFFDDAAEMLKTGDMILISGGSKGGLRMVIRNSGRAVSLGDVA